MIMHVPKYLAIALCAFVLAACSDFLSIEPESSLTTGNAYNSAADAEAALVGCYDVLQVEYFIWDFILLNDVRSDNAYAGALDDANIVEYERLNVSDRNDRIFANWRDLYAGVARCNTLLGKLDGIPDLSQERQSEMLGEARFLRALYYFELVKLFGDIPLVKTTGSADPSETQLPASPQTEIYNFIVEDLEFAVERLPYEYGSDPSVNKARATKGAAYALLAKVWAQRPDRDYNKVLQYADAVINSPAGYSLLSDYHQLFDGNSYNHDEAILVIQFIGGTTEGNWGPQLFLPPSISGDGWRKYQTPSQNLVAAFEAENDEIRASTTIIWEEVEWIDEYWNTGSSPGPVPFTYKFKNANAWNSGDHIYLIRLADILLLKAEAQYHLGQGDRGRAIVNQIRARVELPPTDASDSELIDAILHERRLEFALEGHRWNDLVRFGKAVEVMNAVQDIDLITNQVTNYNISEADLFLPIPADERDRNPNL